MTVAFSGLGSGRRMPPGRSPGSPERLDSDFDSGSTPALTYASRPVSGTRACTSSSTSAIGITKVPRIIDCSIFTDGKVSVCRRSSSTAESTSAPASRIARAALSRKSRRAPK
ncbi:hypothetical protein GCM10009565_52960 [Amycolatopsis albidoflavus]